MGVLPADKAAEKYRKAIQQRGGPDAWYECGDKYTTGGIQAVAECMKSLKKKRTLDDWVDMYRAAYTFRA